MAEHDKPVLSSRDKDDLEHQSEITGIPQSKIRGTEYDNRWSKVYERSANIRNSRYGKQAAYSTEVLQECDRQAFKEIFKR